MVHFGQTLQRICLYGLPLLGSAQGRLQPRADDHDHSAAAADIPKELTDCFVEESRLHCKAGDKEYQVSMSLPAAVDPSIRFTDCHAHDEEIFCVASNGADVLVWEVEDDHDDHDHDDHSEETPEEHAKHEEEAAAEGSSEGLNCHFHAGVEHCTGGGAETAARVCSRPEREYNIPLRIGLIFAMLATSTLGVYLPIFAVCFIRPENIIFTIMRQFGTGIIISTAFVHLFTHAILMFQNECLGDRIEYESTAAAILMAGLFLSFLIEYAGVRLVQWHRAKLSSKSIEESSDGTVLSKPANSLRSELINVYVLEAGIIFHSFLIGLTLVVSGDAFFITLYIVIVFHQFFEGIALGTRIAALGLTPTTALPFGHSHGHHHHAHVQVLRKPETSPVLESHQSPSESSLNAESEAVSTVSRSKKLILAALFAFVTPAGMALGTGILTHFNGNDPATLIAIGTLDAFSAGILVWVGIVEMWAHDWMLGGEMTNAGPLKTILGLGGLMLGMILMSLLGKWA